MYVLNENSSIGRLFIVVCFFKQKTAYEMRISDWSSDVCSSDLEDQRSPARWREFCGTGDHVGRSAAKPEACHEAKCQQHPPIGGPSGGDCERAEDRDADHHGFASPQAIRKRAKYELAEHDPSKGCFENRHEPRGGQVPGSGTFGNHKYRKPF